MAPRSRPATPGATTWRRRLERLLLVVGIACLGLFALAFAESRAVQLYQGWRLDRVLAEAEPAARVIAPTAPSAPAAEPGAVPMLTAPALVELPGDDLGPAADELGPEPTPDRAPAVPAAAPADAAPQPAADLLGRVSVPRLGLSAIVLEGIDSRTLRRAVGHVPGTAHPGERGNIALAGHRDTFFRDLRHVRPNDTITLETPQGTLTYRVEGTAIVPPEEVSVLADHGDDRLTLVTCYPFAYLGPAPLRFIVTARPVAGPAAA